MNESNRFDGASVPTPRTDEIRHVTLESLLDRIDEALAAIASLDLGDSRDLEGSERPDSKD